MIVVFALSALAGEYPPEVQRVVDVAQQAGVPTSAIEDKAKEGLAKGVPSARIAEVLGERVAQLREAQELLGPQTPPSLVIAAAAALRADATPQAIRHLARAKGPSQALSVQVLADLLGSGVSESDAIQMIDLAASGAGRGHAVQGLVTAVTALNANGHSSDQAAAAILSNMANGQGGNGRPDEPGRPANAGRPDTPGRPSNPGNSNR